MRLFRRRRKGDGTSPRARAAALVEELERWIEQRHGVEVFLEPRTTVTGVSVLLVAHDGEFTRRLIGDEAAARDFARSHALPLYEAGVVGYPQRMRDYSRKQSILRKREQQQEVDPDR